MNSLRVRIFPDDDGTGELEARVASDEFAGLGRAWFNLSGIQEFAQSLRGFPLSSEHPPTIQGGFWKPEGGINQCHLRVRVQPYNARGTLLVVVDLATPSRDAPDRDVQQKVNARFLSEYAAVGRFADALVDLVAGKVDEAVLVGRERGLI